jgi:outer membrane protein OmpA-like peptidoglycan-associated protein
MTSLCKYSLGFCAAITLALGACSHKKTKEDLAEHPEEAPPKTAESPKPVQSTIEAKGLAAEQEASYVTELTFPKGKNQLTPDAHERLTKIIDKARAHGKISDVKVITWADAEYPSVHTKNLSRTQVRLATERNDEIKRFLKNIDSQAKVTTYNMAERPSALSDLFGTSNAQIKKSLEVAGIPNSDTSVKTPPKASKSIVMVILKD